MYTDTHTICAKRQRTGKNRKIEDKTIKSYPKNSLSSASYNIIIYTHTYSIKWMRLFAQNNFCSCNTQTHGYTIQFHLLCACVCACVLCEHKTYTRVCIEICAFSWPASNVLLLYWLSLFHPYSCTTQHIDTGDWDEGLVIVRL